MVPRLRLPLFAVAFEAGDAGGAALEIIAVALCAVGFRIGQAAFMRGAAFNDGVVSRRIGIIRRSGRAAAYT